MKTSEESTRMKIPPCPICGPLEGGSSVLHFLRDVHRSRTYWQCSTCQSVFLDPADYLTRSEEEDRYSQHQNDPQEPGYRAFLEPLVQALQQEHDPSQRGLDFGCGPTATFATILGAEGFRMDADDPLFFNRRRDSESPYDFIVASEVVEHFHEPVKEFRRLRERVATGGRLWVMTSVFEEGIDFERWSYRTDPTHVIFYSPRALELLADGCGWEKPRRSHPRVWSFRARL